MALYDEVSEEQYKSIVRGRLAKDDFVVDDGVGGYMDNGMDDFEEKGDFNMSDEDNSKLKGTRPEDHNACLRDLTRVAQLRSHRQRDPNQRPKANLRLQL